jgi:hypothetical protein
MPHYFSAFPTINYALPSLNKTNTVTDITRRFVIRDFYKKNLFSFFKYDITDGNRPDSVAYELYGDSTLDWLILLPNEIIDPYFQWPLDQNRFNEFIRKKYGSVSTAMGTIHHYEQIIQNRLETVNSDGEKIFVPERTLQVDQTTYLSLSVNAKKEITAYDYELAKNERNRTISVIDIVYVPSIVDRFRNLYI